MLLGVPKEIKTNENRVALVPAGTEALVAAGHQVLVEQGAGVGSGFTTPTSRPAPLSCPRRTRSGPGRK